MSVIKHGQYLNAMNAASAERNEQNLVTVQGEQHSVAFKQIAGLLARRIVFTRKIGDRVACGERVGLIKFGSRVDVFLPAPASVRIKLGDHVKGGASVLALLPVAPAQAVLTGSELAGSGQVNLGAR